MERKLLSNLWFVCDKCGAEEWAKTPTSDENKFDALEKARIREEYEHKKCESKG